MGNEKKFKILLIGPVSTGKTAIANFLSDSTDNSIGDNRPTKGVRILEYVVQGVKTNSVYQKNVEVELWDCSGDIRYQTCWPAMQHGTNGIVFVYSEVSNQQKSTLNKFYNFFIEQSQFPVSCCLVVKNQLSDEEGGRITENPLPNLSHAVVNLEVKGVEFRRNFNSFLSTVVKSGSKILE